VTIIIIIIITVTSLLMFVLRANTTKRQN